MTPTIAGVAGIDGPRHGPEADGSQKPNDAAAIPCAKAGSNGGVSGARGETFSPADADGPGAEP